MANKNNKTSKAAPRKTRKGWKNGTAKRADGRTGDNPCLCGCGTLVAGRFAQGHDARVAGWLKRKAAGEEVRIPESVQKALRAGTLRLHTAPGKPVLKATAAA